MRNSLLYLCTVSNLRVSDILEFLASESISQAIIAGDSNNDHWLPSGSISMKALILSPDQNAKFSFVDS